LKFSALKNTFAKIITGKSHPGKTTVGQNILSAHCTIVIVPVGSFHLLIGFLVSEDPSGQG